MDAKEQYIHSRKINLLYLNSAIPAILSGIIGLCLVATLWNSMNHKTLILWFSLTLCMVVVRASLIIAFKKYKPTGKQLLKWEAPYTVTLFITVFNWSVGLLFIIPKDNLNVMFIVTVFAIGLAAAATAWYGQIRYIQLTTVSLVLIPTIAVLLTYGQYEAIWLGIAASFMYFGCLFTSHIFHQTLNDNLALTYTQEQSIIEAESIAHTDSLTVLNNRRGFFEVAPDKLTECQQRHLPACLITFDVDHFKNINDTFGHASGDIALQRIASLLKRNLRTSDISCRLGGEEFAIFLPNVALEKAVSIAEKLRLAMETTPIIISRKKSIAITSSFGVSDIGNNIDEMLNYADQAMYEAKKNGRNQVVVYKSEVSKTVSKVKTREAPNA